MNGVVRPVSGSSRVTPPMMVNTCNAKANDRPGGQQLAEGLPTLEGYPQTSSHDEPVDQDHCHEPGHAELFTNRGG